jgi:N-acetylneuraminic acid mutarotase
MNQRIRKLVCASALMIAVGLLGVGSPSSNAVAQPGGSIWAERAPLPERYSEIAITQLGTNIYVMGGYPSSRRYVDTVQVYDAATDGWSYGVPLPRPMHHPMAATVNGRVYVIGGEISDTGLATAGTYLDSVYEFDPATRVWTQRASMPTARSSGAADVIDGKIYVAGGRPPRGSDFAVYDPATDSWQVLPDLPTQRNHLAAAAIGGKLYVAGGRFGAGVGSEMTSVLEIYDPATNSWSRGASMPAGPRGGVNGIAARGCFYVFGGEGNDFHPLGVFVENEVYDPRTDTWQSLEPIPIPVHGATGSAFISGWVHLPGGGTSRGGESGSNLHQVFRADVSCE